MRTANLFTHLSMLIVLTCSCSKTRSTASRDEPLFHLRTRARSLLHKHTTQMGSKGQLLSLQNKLNTQVSFKKQTRSLTNYSSNNKRLK